MLKGGDTLSEAGRYVYSRRFIFPVLVLVMRSWTGVVVVSTAQSGLTAIGVIDGAGCRARRKP